MTRKNFWELRLPAILLAVFCSFGMASAARAQTAALFIFGHYKIASESMQPTLEVGDHVFTNNLAFSPTNLPKRGDVVVFRSPQTKYIIISRIAGIPSDEIQTIDGRLYINGAKIERSKIDEFSYKSRRGWRTKVTVYTEQLPGEKQAHTIFEQFDHSPLDNSGPFMVPAGKYFIMGDNRDNSADSRYNGGPGFVPMTHIIGRAEMMVFSFKKCKEETGLHCPNARWFLKL